MIDIIIPSYNCRDKLIDTVDSIRANTERGWNLFAVDNASTDGAREWLGQQEDVVLTCNKENDGFSRATNQGVQQSMRRPESAWTVLMNNDIMVPPSWDATMLDALEAHPEVVICSPILLKPRGRRSPELRLRRTREAWGTDTMRDADWLGFSCVFIHKYVWQRYGFLADTRKYWHWGSDTEFCQRVMAGADGNRWRICYYTGLGIYHYHGAAREFVQHDRAKRRLDDPRAQEQARKKHVRAVRQGRKEEVRKLEERKRADNAGTGSPGGIP